jgi:hypothetical protein
MCALQLKDYGDRRGIKTLTIHRKGGKIRYLPVHLKAIAVLEDYLTGSPHVEAAPLFIPSPRQVGGKVKPMARHNVTYLLERYTKGLGGARSPAFAPSDGRPEESPTSKVRY